MNRRPEVCRDFQRGSCRFGARCKFLHDTLQAQQHQPSNPFGFGVKNQPQQRQPASNRGGNYYGALSGSTTSQRQQQNQSQPQVKEHKCTDPRVCKQQIKEDFQNEHPMFWRLTSYAHGKYLPNDIIGDVSFEELRAHSYDAGKQGLPFENVIQNERAMFSAKNTEFESLLKNPYRGAAPINATFHSSGPLSPFIPATSNGTKMVFGKSLPINSSPPSNPFSHHASSSPGPFQSSGGFGTGFGKEASGFSFGVRVPSTPALAISPFGTQSSSLSTPAHAISSFGSQAFSPLNAAHAISPFGTQVSSPFGPQSLAPATYSFGTQSSAPVVPAFGTQQSPQSPFGNTPAFNPMVQQNNPQISKGFNNAPAGPRGLFGGNSAIQSVNETMMFNNSHPAQTGLSLTATMSIVPPNNDTSSRNIAGQLLKGRPGQAAEQADIWLKESWTCEEIPEEEPPAYAC